MYAFCLRYFIVEFEHLVSSPSTIVDQHRNNDDHDCQNNSSGNNHPYHYYDVINHSLLLNMYFSPMITVTCMSCPLIVVQLLDLGSNLAFSSRHSSQDSTLESHTLHPSIEQSVRTEWCNWKDKIARNIKTISHPVTLAALVTGIAVFSTTETVSH